MAASAKRSSGNLTGKTITQTLVFVKHWRLAILLFIMTLSLGLGYYVYTTPVYYSKSLVKFNILNLPVHSDSAGTDTPYYRLRRSLLKDFQSRHLIERTAVRLGLVETTGTFATIQEEFVKAVTVDILDDYKFTIVVQPYSPEIAEVWSRAMVEEYKAYQAELRMEYNKQAVTSYTKELNQIREKLMESLDDRLQYQSSSKYAETSLEAAEYNRLLADLFIIRQQIQSAERTAEAIDRSDLAPLEKISRLALFNAEIDAQLEPVIQSLTQAKGPMRVVAAKGESIRVETGAATTAQWQNLQGRLDQLLSERDEAAKTFLPGHQKMRDIDRRVSLLKKQIDLEAEAAVENFQIQFARMKETEKALRKKLPEGQEAVEKLTKNQLEIEMMEAELPWEKAYSDLRKRLEALDFGAGKERILLHYEKLDQVRRTPTSPNKRKLLFAACAVGLALGAGVPLGVERFNDTASKIDELEQALNLKGLGIVPVTPPGELENIVRSPEIDARIPNSLLENFRVIRAGITLNGDPENKAQVIMVTSARPSEGKTVNSCNLGWAFASVNEPTLLIDSDLRRGRVHKVLDIPNDVGLSSVLMGRANLEDAIQPTKVPNLWAITRGPVIPGATEKLCTPEHDRRMQALRQKFVRIVMDTPPVLGLSETGSLMRVVDGVALVIRAERTTQRDVNAAATILRKAGAFFYGFILNRLDLRRMVNYYNYYYYSSYYYDQMIEDEQEAL